LSLKNLAARVLSKRIQTAAIVLVFAVLLAALSAGLALASDSPPDSEAQGFVVPDSAAELEALTESSIRVGTDPPTDPAVAAELPHSDLGRDEAQELLTSVFPSALEEQAGVFNDLEVEAFRSDHVAVVPADHPGEEPGLLSSLLPLRVDNGAGEKEVVDLNLQSQGGVLEPGNPLVDVRIPTSLDQEVRLPEVGLGIQFEAAVDRSASVISQAAAFYPNIADETDLTILPTPTGLETLTQLRSPAAPTSQKLHLDLPDGATLHETELGGATICRGEEVLVGVNPPTAIDANGDPVSVKMEISGSSLILDAEPEEDAAYPILVDPVFESYSWMNSENKTGIYEDWLPYTSNSNVFKPGWIGTIGGQFRFGLALRSSVGATAPGSSMNWNYYVPRYLTDKENPAVNERPTSYVRNMTLSQVYFVLEDSPVHSHPYLAVGLWDENKGEFASLGVHGGLEGAYNGVTLSLPNPSENTDVKNVGFALATSESASYQRQAFVGSASVEVTDKDFPTWGELGSVGEWLSSQTKEIPYKATDTGLGIHDLRIRYTAARGGPGEGMISIGCTGTASSACPRTSSTATKPFLFDSGAIAQGENWVNLYAVDPVGHWSEVGTSKIKVDREPPELGLSGNLTEQKSVGTKLSQYSLKLDVKDGDEATAAAATPIGYAGTGTGEIERPQDVEDDSAGNIWVTDRVNNRIVKYSPNGVYLSQITGTVGTENQVTEPRDLAISANGNLWVAETTYKRVRQYSPTGSIVSTIKNAELESPYGVAIAPDGAVWVTDSQNGKVLQFKQDGTLIRTIRRPASDIPTGIDIDEYGNGWVVMQGSNRVVELSSTGSEIFSFGSEGTEAGKFKVPTGVAIAPSGNIFVSDGSNNRIQEFKPDGGFMRQFGTVGTASNQLSEPRGIAVLPGNVLAIADAANKRVARWNHADRHIESGAVKTEVKVDGTLTDTYNPGCAAGKNCAISREWVMKADNYSVGSHKVDVIATDGVGTKSEKSLTVETHGDLQPPTVALSGTMTEQATLGNTRPTYKLKETATDPGSTEERKSGVASTSIKVDGTVVDSSSPGCSAGGCSITREWTLNSSSYAPGSHTVEIKATDAAGHTTTKTLSIKIERDTTAPQLTLSGALPGAPEGWVQDGMHGATVEATDEAGYGVKQIRFLIDGVLVGETATQSCEAGGCGKSTTFSVNMTPYSGGAHQAVMAAEDGAGNVRKKTWTINLDPEGNISASEAIDTLEALDVTSPVNTVGPAAGEAQYEGTSPNLSLEEVEGVLIGKGPAAPIAIPRDTPGELMVEVPTNQDYTKCANRSAEESEAARTGAEEEQLSVTAGCNEVLPASPEAFLTPLTVTPTGNISGASQSSTSNDAAAVASNVAPSTDLVTRPLYDGGMTFSAIRDAVAPQSFSWKVNLEAGQELLPIDTQTARVRYASGPTAFTISAIPAHDAIGASVPTHLTVTGDTLTLWVEHRSAAFVYPVVGGAGWEGGFQTYKIVMPTGEAGELEAEQEGEGWYKEVTIGPPEPSDWTSAPTIVNRQHGDPKKRNYNFHECRFGGEGYNGEAPPGTPGNIHSMVEQDIVHKCHGYYDEVTGAHHTLSWAISIHGSYRYQPHEYAWLIVRPECEKWGENQPAKLSCVPGAGAVGKGFSPHIDIRGFYRFAPGNFEDIRGGGQPICYEMNGVLPDYYVRQEGEEGYPSLLEDTLHTYYEVVGYDNPCTWSHLDNIG